MSSELGDLFERTLPSDELVLRRMASARLRREERPALFRRSRFRGWTASAAAACAAVLALFVSFQTPPTELRAERFGALPEQTLFEKRLPAGSLVRHAAPVSSSDPLPPRAASTDSRLRSEPSPGPLRTIAGDDATTTAELPGSLAGHETASWEAAARALRSGDREEAARLLAQLAESDDPAVRDGALLVRLRARVNERSSDQAASPLSADERGELETLARSGRTASIRASAKQLLEETK